MNEVSKFLLWFSWEWEIVFELPQDICWIWKYKFSISYCPWLIYPESDAIENSPPWNQYVILHPAFEQDLWHLCDVKMSPKSPVRDVQETLFQGGPGEGEGGAAPKKEMIVSVSGAGDTRTSVRPVDTGNGNGNGNGSNTNMCRVNSEAGTTGGRNSHSCSCFVLIFLVLYGMWFSRNVLYIVSPKCSKRNVHTKGQRVLLIKIASFFM